MAILAIFTGNGITRQMYDSLRKEVHWESQHAAGAISHAAAFDADGQLHVADVWESAEAMDAFVKGRLMPAMQELNVPAPSVSVFPAHNVNIYPAADKFRVQ